MSLKEIDSHISETDYSKALVELSDYLKSHPDELDAVQKRIDKIMNARQEYYILADQLIDVMEKEPENAQKKLEIISRLETVEKNPTEQQLAFIRQAKIAAQFTYYRAQFRHIVEDSEEKAARGEYVQAVLSIQKGFNMYKAEFYEENPKSVTDVVTSQVNKIESLCKNYSALQDKLKSSYNAFCQAVKSGNYRDSLNAYNVFEGEMKKLSDARNEIAKTAEDLRVTFTRLQKKNPNLTEASYLPFIFRFSLGLENSPYSGIAGAMDRQFAEYVEGVKPLIYSTVAMQDFTEINAEKISLIKQDELSLSKLALISDFSNLGIKVNSMYSMLNNSKADNTYSNYVRSMQYAASLSESTKTSYAVLDRFQKTNEALSVIEKPLDAVEGIRSKNSYAQKMIDCSKMFVSCAEDADAQLKKKWFTDYEKEISENEKNKNTGKNSIYKFEKISGYYSKLNKTIYDESIKRSQVQWKNTAVYFASASVEIVDYYEKEYAKTNELLEKRYPEEALDLISKTEKALDTDAKTLIDCRDTLIKSPIEKSSFAQEEKIVVDCVNRMNNLKLSSASNKAKCSEEILLAKRSVNEAELRYEKAVAAFRKQNYTEARKNIELCSAKYKEAFDHQESPSLREESDKKLMALGQQINDAENKIVVAEVRELKNKAKNEYYNGNFEKAENLLAQAKSRWAVTNGEEEDEEIKNLLAIVETALSMKTGRVIPATAPLYPEMSQILSIAHQFFDQGASLIKKGKTEEGKEYLAKSKQKLQEIQLVYPLNQEASLLTLKIDQLTDPDSFNEMFERKIKSAKENYRIASRQQQAYTDLLDLYEIRPDYPGLKKLIYQVEIEIGVRQKPIDNTAIVKADALTREAQKIINAAGKNESQLRSALEKLDQAIALNPNNDQAILLKDRVQVSLGGRASVVISSADEAKYQEAIQELQKNNIVGAYALVEQLLQNPQNKRSAKILDLQKKVKALL